MLFVGESIGPVRHGSAREFHLMTCKACMSTSGSGHATWEGTSDVEPSGCNVPHLVLSMVIVTRNLSMSRDGLWIQI